MTVKEKQNVTLPCKAAGFPSPLITWYKDGNIIAGEKKHFNKRNLEILNILYEDHGIYTCTAENLLGRVQLSINVTVYGKYNKDNNGNINNKKQKFFILDTCLKSTQGVKVAGSILQYFPRLSVWWVIIIISILYRLMPKSWYQQTAQSLVNKLLLFLWHSSLP